MKSFNSFTETNNTLMIVDLLNLCFRFRHNNITDFKEDCLRTIDSLRKSYKASKVIIACDKGSSSYRKGIYPEYKQNRKDKFETQTEAEKLAFELFFKEFEATVEYIETETEYPVLRYQGVEADDIAAYVVSRRKTLGFDHIWLISSDKDWDLLIQPDVSRFSYVTRKEVTFDNWSEHYDFSPEEYISIKCLTGDAGDNVKGVEGIGPKRAVGLVSEYGSTYDIIASLPIQSKYKYIQSLNNSGELLMLNYQLMDLVTHCKEAIGEDNLENINRVITEYIG